MKKEILLSDRLSKNNLNLHTLSERSGVAYSTVYNLFTGKKRIEDATTESLYKLARILDMTLDELYLQFKEHSDDNDQIIPDFLLMWEDEVVSSVHIGPLEVLIERYDNNPVKQIFYADKISRFTFGEILKNRCFDQHRPDLYELLSILGLNEFNPYEICRKTHGKMIQDKTWFKFDGETITYKDLTRSKHAC